MKMPTTSAGGRTRGKAKATARKTTLTRSMSARTTTARKAKATKSRARATTKAKFATKSRATAKARTKAKAPGRSPAKRASRASSAQVSGSARTTTNHAKIQQWAEARRGIPATVKSTRSKREPGILRIDFPGYSGKNSLQKISWDEWFEKFDESGLEFLYQDKTKDGKQSRFFKLVNK